MTYESFCQYVRRYGFLEPLITETGFNELKAIGFDLEDMFSTQCDLNSGFSYDLCVKAVKDSKQ